MADEKSHGKPYLIRDRLSDVAELPSDLESVADRSRSGRDTRGRFAANNTESVRSSEKAMIERREKAALARELEAAVRGVASSERAQLLQQTLKLYNATRRDLPAESPVVLSATLSFAREHVIAAALFEKATELGISTPEGMTYLEAGQKAEARAERASLQAFTLAAKLASSIRGRKLVDATPWLEEPNDDPTPPHAPAPAPATAPEGTQ